MLDDRHRRFIAAQRAGHLATAGRDGAPHVVPVCFALAEATLYITIDEKPKRTDRPLKRVMNIQENPSVAVVVDHYEENWKKLGWVMLRGRADILAGGAEHGKAQALLRGRYPQLEKMRIEQFPVIAIRIERVTAWGNLCPDERGRA